LQKKLETIADQIGVVGFWVAVVTFSVLIIRLLLTTMMAGNTAFLSF
jgi:hypothetical protein